MYNSKVPVVLVFETTRSNTGQIITFSVEVMQIVKTCTVVFPAQLLLARGGGFWTWEPNVDGSGLGITGILVQICQKELNKPSTRWEGRKHMP